MADEKEKTVRLLAEESLSDGEVEKPGEDDAAEAPPATGDEEAPKDNGDSGAGTDSPGEDGPATGDSGERQLVPKFAVTIVADESLRDIQLIPSGVYNGQTLAAPGNVDVMMVEAMKTSIDYQRMVSAVIYAINNMGIPVKTAAGQETELSFFDYLSNNVVGVFASFMRKQAQDKALMEKMAAGMPGNKGRTPGGIFI